MGNRNRDRKRDLADAPPPPPPPADDVVAPPAAPPADEPAPPPPADEPPPPPPVVTLVLKAKREVTRYTVKYNGVVYESPRKALDAAGLPTIKGSVIRTALKGQPVGTLLKVTADVTFEYTGSPA